jgi:hypothetical protein
MTASNGRFATGAVAFALYAALAVVVTYPLILHLSGGFMRGIDSADAFQQAWILSWVDHAARLNPFGLFEAPIFVPSPNALAYMDCMLPVALLVLPVQVATDNAAITYNIAVLLSFPLSGICMYAWAACLCRDRRAAWLAGVIYAFCPYRLRHLEHLNVLSAEFIPLTLLCFDLARQSRSRAPWFALGGCLLGGALTSLYYFAFTLIALAAYAAALIVTGHMRLVRPRPGDLVLLCLPLGVLAILLMPYAMVMRVAAGARRLQDVVFFAADARDFLHDSPRSLLYGWSDGIWRLGPLDGRQYLFPGLVAVVLAAAACGRPEGSPTAPRRTEDRPSPATVPRVHAGLAALFALLAMGPYLKFFGTFNFGTLGNVPLPYLALYDLLPPLRGLRDVARIDQVAMAFLAVTAAAGAARLLRRWQGTATWRYAVLCLLAVLEYTAVGQTLVPVQSGATAPPVYIWLREQPPGNVLELPVCDNRLPWSLCTEEYTYMFFQTIHWHPLINGWQGSGSYPPEWIEHAAALESFPAAASRQLMAQLRVRYLVIHPDFPALSRSRSWLDIPSNRARAGIRAVATLGGDVVLVLDVAHD